MFEFLVAAVIYVANWMIFVKMGRPGWESLIPFYAQYIQFKLLYGDGWKFLLLLVPLYNIYIAIKFCIDLARAFHQSDGFAAGLILLSPVFMCILAFGPAQYGDGSMAGEDFVTNAVDTVKAKVEKTQKKEAAETTNDIFDSIHKLQELHDAGMITDQEFENKKEELLNRL